MKNLTDVTENKDIATKEYVDSAKNIWYGTCSSTAATNPKIVTTDTQDFTLEEGNVVYIQFDNASGNLGDDAFQLNIDGTGAINIYSEVGTWGVNWSSGSVVGFVYNGTNFIGINKSIANFYWYGETKLDNAIDSTSNTTAATPSAVKQAYDLANGKQDALVSGTNIKTINNQSLLGSGDLTINVPTKTSDLTNDSGFITGYTETDPTVPSWAKASTKPSYTASEISGLMDFFYPVGSYYETSDTTFDPNVSWGGTWSLETEGQVHVSSGNNYAISGALTDTSDGGSPYIQAHTHGFTNPEYTIAQGALTTSGMSANASHSHGTGNSTHDRFAVYRSTGNGILRRTIKNGTGTSYDGNVHTDDTWSRLASTQSVSTAHTHTAPTNAYKVPNSKAGSVNAINTSGLQTGNDGNMQPYIVVNRWHRTA